MTEYLQEVSPTVGLGLNTVNTVSGVGLKIEIFGEIIPNDNFGANKEVMNSANTT